MRCSVSYLIVLKGGQARVNILVVQQYDLVVVLRAIAVLCTRSVLAFLNMASNPETTRSFAYTAAYIHSIYPHCPVDNSKPHIQFRRYLT